MPATARLLAIAMAPVLLLGEGGRNLTGVVEDGSGGAISGARVTLINSDTRQTQDTASDSNGKLSFQDLFPGHYVLKVVASGFEPHQEDVAVGPQKSAFLKIQLTVGTVRQQVTVKEDPADEISTSDGAVAAAQFDPAQLRGLPAPSEDIASLVARFVFPAAQGAGGTSVVVDGAEGEQLDLPVSAIRKLRINRNPFSAAFQRPGTGRAEVSTKRGHRSHFEGSLAYSARNSVFDARNAFARSSPESDRRLLESKFGGPFPGRRASFFVAAQRLLDDENAIVNAVTPAGAVTANIPTPRRRDRVYTRLQAWPTDLHTFFGTYAFTKSSRRQDQVGGFRLPEQAVDTAEREHKAVLGYSAMFSANWRNESRFSIRAEDKARGEPAGAAAIVVNQAFTSGPAQSFTRDEKHAFHVADTAGYFHGRNQLLMGGSYWTDRYDAFDGSNFGGTFEFASLAQYAAARPFVFRVNQGAPRIAVALNQASGFVQDEFRVRPDVTATFGLRYDWQAAIGDHNLAPRIAFAFAPGRQRKTVVRAGAGIFYDDLPRAATQRSLLYDGVRLRELVISNPSFPDPFLSGRVISPRPSLVRIASDIRSPYLFHALAGVERELWPGNPLSVEYLFFRGLHLFRSRDVNAPLPGTGLRPDPNFQNVNQVESSALMRSQALTVTYSGRLGRFFKPYARYMFSRTSDDTAGVFALPADNYNLRAERGAADLDRRHRLNLMGVLALPLGFQLGTVLSAASGAPFNITTGFDDNGDTVANDRPAGVTRNTGRGPGALELDLRFTKAFVVSRLWRIEAKRHERHLLEFSVDAFNATNHTNVDGLVGVRSSPFFGRANSAAPARRLQFTARYIFPD